MIPNCTLIRYLEEFEKCFPGKTIVQVDSRSIIGRGGVLHCMSLHVFDCTGTGE